MATRKKKKETKTSTASSVASDLREYRRKRDFDRTGEPSGADDQGGSSGRLFVVQKHAARHLHYDFRLEFDGVLKSWAVPKGPSLDPTQKPLAVHVEDHPMEYARFEGVIPKGEYGGGSVMVWDIGEWEPLTDPVEGLAKGDLKFRLRGEKLRGAWVLARMSGDAGEGGKNWLLIKKKDEESRSIGSFNVLGELPRSVLSDRTLDEVAADPEAVWTGGREQPILGKDRKTAVGPPKKSTRKKDEPQFDPSKLLNARKTAQPSAMKPQLASTASTAPEGKEWLHEIKLDGYRLIGVIDNGSVTLLTRNGHDWTDRFKSVAAAMMRLPIDQAIVDGEVVVLNAQGISDFGALQNAFRGYTRRPFTYFLFDIPYALRYDLRKTPLIERKNLLRRIVQAAPLAAPTVQYCDHILGNGPTVFQKAAEAGLEGIISKRAAAVYESRRTHSWVKVKATLRQEFVIGGFTDPSGSRSGFGALVLGYYNDDNELVYCGRVGTGFSDHALNSIAKELAPRLSDEPPFVNAEVDPEFKSLHWVRPELVAEVEFTAWTHENLLRHPSFRGLRADIDPTEVIREDAAPANRGAIDRKRTKTKTKAPMKVIAATRVVKTPGSPEDIAIAGVRISNPHRTVYPDDGVTKLAVAMYYEKVARWMLPYISHRPLSLVRCPLGLAGDSFFQRHLGEGFPKSIKGLEINIDDTGQLGLMITDTNGLLSLAQMGVLEIHIWGCRADNIEKPDMLVFDLDPGEGIEWEHIVESARFLRDYLDDVGLRSFVKTTGGNGLHLVSPIGRRSTWDEAKAFTKAIADDLVRIAPMNFVATMTKTLRKQRIFIDYLRNLRGATFVAPYSTRARNGACVSTPLGWDELSTKAPPSHYTVSSVPDRMADLEDDPWEGFDSVRQSITAAMKRKFKLS